VLSSNVDPNADFTLAASGWEGTTLTGYSLAASLYGNGTLIGTGAGAILTAGNGIDTLQGSSAGNSTFYLPYGLADRSVVEAYGYNSQISAGNSLFGEGLTTVDISNATITGVQDFSWSGNVILTAAQFDSFSTIYAG